jgi:hypothetical protein
MQKLVDDSKTQKQKIAKLEIKIKELENIINHSSKNGLMNCSDNSDDDKFTEYEMKFDTFKQEVNLEILKINNSIQQSNKNIENQISSVRSQIAQLISLPKRGFNGKC